MEKTLITFFSASGVTKKVAENLSKVLSAPLYEITPKIAYTNADLDWRDKQSRSSVEMSDKTYRPELGGESLDISGYDTVFLGFPIWWYVAPTLVNTFLEKYDFSGKTIVVFATSGSSGLGKTVEELKPSVGQNVKFVSGGMLNNSPTNEELKKWVNGLSL